MYFRSTGGEREGFMHFNEVCVNSMSNDIDVFEVAVSLDRGRTKNEFSISMRSVCFPKSL